MNQQATKSCPKCGQKHKTEVTFAPFCSKRCKEADLAKWLTEEYAIERDVTYEDLNDPSLAHDAALIESMLTKLDRLDPYGSLED